MRYVLCTYPRDANPARIRSLFSFSCVRLAIKLSIYKNNHKFLFSIFNFWATHVLNICHTFLNVLYYCDFIYKILIFFLNWIITIFKNKIHHKTSFLNRSIFFYQKTQQSILRKRFAFSYGKKFELECTWLYFWAFLKIFLIRSL